MSKRINQNQKKTEERRTTAFMQSAPQEILLGFKRAGRDSRRTSERNSVCGGSIQERRFHSFSRSAETEGTDLGCIRRRSKKGCSFEQPFLITDSWLHAGEGEPSGMPPVPPRLSGLSTCCGVPSESPGPARLERSAGNSLPSISSFNSSASMVSRSSNAAAMRCMASGFASRIVCAD